MRLSCAVFPLALLVAAPTMHSIAGADDYYSGSGSSIDATRTNGTSYQPGAVRPATHQEPMPMVFPASNVDKPLLLPARPGDSSGEKSSSGPRTMGAIVSVIGSLAVVLGLFFVVAWLMRRSMPQSARRLPGEVVETLGRVPLAGRQQMHLLRFGNKLLLVCVSPTGVDTLGEITDPSEIDRVAALCAQNESSGATKTFHQIFGQRTGDKSRAAQSGVARRTFLPSTARTAAIAEEAADV